MKSQEFKHQYHFRVRYLTPTGKRGEMGVHVRAKNEKQAGKLASEKVLKTKGSGYKIIGGMGGISKLDKRY